MHAKVAFSLLVLSTVILVLILTVAGNQATAGPVHTSAEIILSPAADTYITNRNAATNYGDDDYLELWYDEYYNEGAYMLFRFQLQGVIDPQAIIDSATLELYQIEEGTGVDPVNVALHPILEPWDELTVNWTNQPDVYTGPFFLSTPISAEAGWKSINVTQFADDWLAGDDYGLELRWPLVEFERYFESSEHSEREPQLVVRYHHPPTATNTPTNTATPSPTDTPTNTPSPTPTSTDTPTNTPSPTPTNTPSPTPTTTPEPTPSREPVEPQYAALERLRRESRVEPDVFFEHGVPRHVFALAPVPDDVPDEPVIQALDFLTRYKDLYGLQNPCRQLFPQRIATDDLGGTHVFFGLRNDDLAVFASDLVVDLWHGYVAGTSGNYLAQVPNFPPPEVKEQDVAVLVAEAYPGASIIGRNRLVVYSPLLVGEPGEEPHQVWQVSIRDKDGTARLVLFDSQSGDILFTRIGLIANRPGEDFDIRSLNSSIAGGDCSALGTQWFTEAGQTTNLPPGGDAEGLEAFNAAHDTYHYFYDSFGNWRSFNGDGALVRVFLDATALTPGGTCPNAWYRRSCRDFVYCNNEMDLDVFAHEFTHGFTHQNAGLDNKNQGGAVNESFADIFAMMVDTANWTIGEGDGPTPNPSRNIKNPPAITSTYGGGVLTITHPDHMDDYFDHVELAVEDNPVPGGNNDGVCNPGEACFPVDNGGVHINCGITNKAAYLLIEGDVHHGIEVRGLGRSEAAWFYFNLLKDWLPSTTDFNTLSAKAIALADILALYNSATNEYDFSVRDACSVRNAYAAVGLAEADVDCDGKLDGADPDDDDDRVANKNDNCPGVPNIAQVDTDGDGTGDACDEDIDGDLHPNDADNCPLVVNPWQEDHDNNGKGDHCEDVDGDWVVDAEDNCLRDINPWQEDADGDGKGDVCDPDADNDGRLNGDDNCPLVKNPKHKDADGDGWGDVCDSCPKNYDPTNLDTDGDGKGDVCDPDADNDGVPNAEDNCPKDRNPQQFDFDGNGFGSACDGDEWINVIPIEGVLDFKEDLIRIPIKPCLKCPDWFAEDTVIRIKLSAAETLEAIVVDEFGYLVARGEPGLNQTINFQPETDTHYQPSCGPGPQAAEIAYEGQHYALEIYAPEEIPEKPIPVHISMQLEKQVRAELYLPVVGQP